MNNYFPHDGNTRNSDMIIPLRESMGAEGYGIYIMLLERLRTQPDYMSVRNYRTLAFDLRADADKIKSVVEDFGLFVFTEDGTRFYSGSLMQSMQIKDDKSAKARESARKRWEKCGRNADASKNDANKVKENKENKSKENKTTATAAATEAAGAGKEKKEISDFIEILKDSPQWIDSICMRNRLEKNELPAWLAEYELFCRCEGVGHDNLRDVMSHFSRWLPTRIRNHNQNSNDTKQNEDRFQRRRGTEPTAESADAYSETL